MRRYSADSGPGVAAGTNLTIIEVIASTSTRGRIYEIDFGSITTPADVAVELAVIRGTVSGTGTSVTPRALDGADPAALLTCKKGTFTGQTKTSNSSLFDTSLNQRATFRWVSVPDGEMIIPATSDNWIGVESISSGSTPSMNVTIHWQE